MRDRGTSIDRLPLLSSADVRTLTVDQDSGSLDYPSEPVHRLFEGLARHLRRNAYLYIRQSTLRQVFENTESTRRQYALRQRALALGWSEEQL